MNKRHEALRAYFLEVTRDLVVRGVLRKQQGQSLDEILRQEFQTVLNEVTRDFGEIAKEMGQGFVQSMIGLVRKSLFGP